MVDTFKEQLGKIKFLNRSMHIGILSPRTKNQKIRVNALLIQILKEKALNSPKRKSMKSKIEIGR